MVGWAPRCGWNTDRNLVRILHSLPLSSHMSPMAVCRSPFLRITRSPPFLQRPGHRTPHLSSSNKLWEEFLRLQSCHPIIHSLTFKPSNLPKFKTKIMQSLLTAFGAQSQPVGQPTSPSMMGSLLPGQPQLSHKPQNPVSCILAILRTQSILKHRCLYMLCVCLKTPSFPPSHGEVG